MSSRVLVALLLPALARPSRAIAMPLPRHFASLTRRVVGTLPSALARAARNMFIRTQDTPNPQSLKFLVRSDLVRVPFLLHEYAV